MSDSQRTEPAAFLRARRAQVTQRDAGLPEDMVPGRRRTPSLRREEVAELAGMCPPPSEICRGTTRPSWRATW